ncbi:MAG TPA: hypothetical protein VN081_06790 [Dongiaceae bacterium]|nr:hypothetical protein [Dongiaceae bacterium]
MNVKAGDLAIIIAANHTPENIGTIVEVVRIAVPGELFANGNIRFTGSPNSAWVTKRDGGEPMPWRLASGNQFVAEEVVCEDRFLRPVSGLPIEEDVHTKDRVPA